MLVMNWHVLPLGMVSWIRPLCEACQVPTAQVLKLRNAAASSVTPSPLQVAAVNSEDPPPVPVQFPVVIVQTTSAVGMTMLEPCNHDSALWPLIRKNSAASTA